MSLKRLASLDSSREGKLLPHDLAQWGWRYIDEGKVERGAFDSSTMQLWWDKAQLPAELRVRYGGAGSFVRCPRRVRACALRAGGDLRHIHRRASHTRSTRTYVLHLRIFIPFLLPQLPTQQVPLHEMQAVVERNPRTATLFPDSHAECIRNIAVARKTLAKVAPM